MADPANPAALAASRLGELPTAGTATRTEQTLTDAMTHLIRQFERDRPLLLAVLIAGPQAWRRRFRAAYRYLHVDVSDLADAVFGYLKLLAGDERTWAAQQARLSLHGEQATIQRWDRRLGTLLRHNRSRQDLEQDILRELLRPRRTYSKAS